MSHSPVLITARQLLDVLFNQQVGLSAHKHHPISQLAAVVQDSCHEWSECSLLKTTIAVQKNVGYK